MPSRVVTALRVRDAVDAVVAGAGGAPADRAGLALDALLDLVGSGAAAVQRWDPVAGRHTTLASQGYEPEILRGIEECFRDDPLFAQVGRRALRVSDIPPQQRRGPVFERVIGPGGFADGVSVCLTAGRRYVGSVHASTGRGGVDDEVAQLLTLLRPDLAVLLDPLEGWADATTDGSVGGFAWCPDDGRLVVLTPHARVDLLRRLPGELPAVGGSWLLLEPPGPLAVDLRRAGRWWVLEHRPAPAPGGLSPRELQVLAEVATGATNREVARRLEIRERTVESHLAHLALKLDVPTRSAAAGVAARWGLLRDAPGDRAGRPRTVRGPAAAPGRGCR